VPHSTLHKIKFANDYRPTGARFKKEALAVRSMNRVFQVPFVGAKHFSA